MPAVPASPASLDTLAVEGRRMIWDDLRELVAIIRRKLPGSPLPLEDRLRQMCHGDAACAERLVAYESSRAPGLSRKEALNRAIERLAHDR